MRTRIILTALLSIFMLTIANADEQDLTANINKVTVFRNGAQIHRSGWITLPKGNTQVIIKGVSPQINAASIQAGGEGEFTILSAQYQLKYEQPGTPPEIKVPSYITRAIDRIQDSILWLDFEVRDMKEQQNILIQEKNLLLNDRSIKNGSDTITELPVILDFFRSRMNNINQEWLKLERKLTSLTTLRADLNRRLQENIAFRNQIQTPPRPGVTPIHQIIVTIAADKIVKGKISLTYLVNGAGWVPSYEIKGGDSPDKVQLVYKGGVYQNTGVDWKNVKITLSNMNPNRSQYKPNLSPWFLNYYTPITVGTTSISNTLQVLSESKSVEFDEDVSFRGNAGDTFLPPAMSGASFTSVSTNFSNVEFAVNLPYDIPSDGTQQVITVGNYDLPAVFVHTAVPKMERECFILAKLTGWESVSLLPGNANVYLGGTLVGSIAINPYVIEDTLTISMGRDPAVVVDRKKVKDDSERPLLSKQVFRTITIELNVRNAKSVPVELYLEDQIPVSQNEKIEVEKIDMAKGDLNDETGMLKWTIKLKPGESRKIRFTYKIIYDKDKPLYID